MRVYSFAELMNGHQSAEIVCAIKKSVVRRLKVDADGVHIDPLEGPVIVVPMDTPIVHEPWFMDRGNMLFSCEEFPDDSAKICTELDVVRFPDGHEEVVEA